MIIDRLSIVTDHVDQTPSAFKLVFAYLLIKNNMPSSATANEVSEDLSKHEGYCSRYPCLEFINA